VCGKRFGGDQITALFQPVDRDVTALVVGVGKDRAQRADVRCGTV
jgi:hypothetical protein